MKNASPLILDVLLIVRSASPAPLFNGAIFDALERQGIDVHRADVTREGITIWCKGDAKTLRLCARRTGRRGPSSATYRGRTDLAARLVPVI